MPAFFSNIRTSLRAQFFKVLRRAVCAEDGRLALTEALRDQLAWRRNELEAFSVEPPPYDLGSASKPQSVAQRDDIVLISGRFRSGSTLLWNLFRNIPGCVSYYEPFNERRWFDPTSRGEQVDVSHRGVDDYWREYEHCEHLGKLYNDQWQDRGFHLGAGDWNPQLKRFIEEVVQCSGSLRPVLQFNRIDFRLPWLRQTFPNATILHIYRHPRDQWCSVLQKNERFPPDGHMADFAAADRFYTLRWARDLKYRFPFLDERSVEHPYQLHYFLWNLSYLYGRSYSDCSLSFEELVTHPEATLFRVLDTCAIDAAHVEPLCSLINPPPLGKWKTYADDAWFRRHETHCDDVLNEFFRNAPSARQAAGTSAGTAAAVDACGPAGPSHMIY